MAPSKERKKLPDQLPERANSRTPTPEIKSEDDDGTVNELDGLNEPPAVPSSSKSTSNNKTIRAPAVKKAGRRVSSRVTTKKTKAEANEKPTTVAKPDDKSSQVSDLDAAILKRQAQLATLNAEIAEREATLAEKEATLKAALNLITSSSAKKSKVATKCAETNGSLAAEEQLASDLDEELPINPKSSNKAAKTTKKGKGQQVHEQQVVATETKNKTATKTNQKKGKGQADEQQPEASELSSTKNTQSENVTAEKSINSGKMVKAIALKQKPTTSVSTYGTMSKVEASNKSAGAKKIALKFAEQVVEETDFESHSEGGEDLPASVKSKINKKNMILLTLSAKGEEWEIEDPNSFLVAQTNVVKHCKVFKEYCERVPRAWENPISFPVEESVMEVFVKWTETTNMKKATNLNAVLNNKEVHPIRPVSDLFHLMAKCWIMGDLLVESETFCNAMMDGLVALSKKTYALGYVGGARDDIIKDIVWNTPDNELEKVEEEFEGPKLLPGRTGRRVSTNPELLDDEIANMDYTPEYKIWLVRRSIEAQPRPEGHRLFGVNKHSPIVRLLLDNHCGNVDVMELQEYMEKHSKITSPDLKEFTNMLTVREIRRLKDEQEGKPKPVFPWKKDPCVYHKHAEKPEGYSCTLEKAQAVAARREEKEKTKFAKSAEVVAEDEDEDAEMEKKLAKSAEMVEENENEGAEMEKKKLAKSAKIVAEDDGDVEMDMGE